MQPFEHGGNIHKIQRQQLNSPLLDFSANINPLGLHSAIQQTIRDSIQNIIHYPDPDAYELRQAISKHYHIPDERLALGNGAAELIYLYVKIAEKKQVLLLAPCFSEYQRACTAVNLPVDFFPLSLENDFKIDYQKLSDAIPHDAIVFLANPNNPTGGLLDLQQLEHLLVIAANRNTDIFVDESFIDFLPDEYSCRKLMDKFDNLAVLHSLTKIFALPGLRLGFGLFNPTTTQLINQNKDVWNVNILAQVAGVTALNQHKYLSDTRSQIPGLREDFVKELSQLPTFKLFPASANFILIRLENWLTSFEFCELMLNQGILVRNCANYPGLNNKFIRIAVRTAQENRLFLEATKLLLDKHPPNS